MTAKRWVLSAAFAVLVVAGLFPVLAMLGKSLVVEGRLSLEHYRSFLTARAWTLASHSFTLSALTTLASLAGLPLGILLGKTDVPFRRALTVLFSLPLLLPPYILAISWFYVLGRGGLVQRWLGPAAAERTSALLFGMPGCVLVLASTLMPIVMLLTLTYLKTVNPRLEEAARLCAGWPSVLKSITLPLMGPGALLSLILVFLLSLGEFSVPSFLRYNVFPVESFTQFSAFLNFGAATAAAIPLALVTLLVLVFESVFLREKTYQVRPAPSSGSEIIGLGWAGPGLSALAGAACFALVILPLSALAGESWAGGAYAAAFAKAGDSLIRSIVYAGIGATALTLLGFLIGYLVQTKALPFWRAADSLTVFLFALPSTVIGIGLICLWNRPATNFIFATPAILILGYVAQYAALTSRITVASLARIPPSMEEAAQIASAGWTRRLTRVMVPLAQGGLIAGWVIGFIFCLRDTGISMLVYPPGFDTLPVRTFTLMANSPPGLVSALCMLMIAAALLPLGLLWGVSRTWSRWN